MSAVDNGITLKEASKLFEIKRTTAISIYKNRGELKKKGGRLLYKITEEMVESLVKKIEKNPFITLKDMKEKLNDQFQVDIHHSKTIG